MSVLVSNNAVGELLVGISDVETALVLRSGQGSRFPAPIAGKDWFYITVQDAQGNLEVMKCTARTSDTLTVKRSTDAPRAFIADSVVELRPCAELFDDKADAKDFADYTEDAEATHASLRATITALTKQLNDAVTRLDNAITELNTKAQKLENSISDSNKQAANTYVTKTSAEATYVKLAGNCTISGPLTLSSAVTMHSTLKVSGLVTAAGNVKTPTLQAATVKSSTVQSGVTYS